MRPARQAAGQDPTSGTGTIFFLKKLFEIILLGLTLSYFVGPALLSTVHMSSGTSCTIEFCNNWFMPLNCSSSLAI